MRACIAQVRNNELGSAAVIDARRYSAISGLRIEPHLAGYEDYVRAPPKAFLYVEPPGNRFRNSGERWLVF